MSALYPQVPDPEQRVFRRLIRKTIAGGQTVDLQIDGLETLLSAVGGVVQTMIGEVAVRATLSRAAVVTVRRYPRLGNLASGNAGLDIAWLRRELRTEAPARARETLVALVEEWLNILYWLLGYTLMPLLREAEAELGTRQPSPEGDEEEG